MTASEQLGPMLLDWQNKSQQLESKIWTNGMSSMQRGVVVRCDHEAFAIADPSAKLHISFSTIERIMPSQPGVIELSLSFGLLATICEIK